MRAICIAATAAILVGTPLARGELANGIKAIVHDSVVTYEEVESLTAQAADVVVRQYRGQPGELNQKLAELRQENLEQQIDRQLILHEFKTAGYNLPESLVDNAVADRIKTRFGDRVTLTRTLQTQGVTFEKFRQQVREQFILEAMRNKNISAELLISPHKVEVYYREHQADFKTEDAVKLRMIVLNKAKDDPEGRARKLGEEILTRLREGASFAELAGIYSQGSQRAQGGDWGWVEKSVLRKELAETAFSLKAGERSGVVDTPDACYLMQVDEVRPAHIKPLAEVRDAIERNLVLEERSRLERQWVGKMKKKTFVRYF